MTSPSPRTFARLYTAHFFGMRGLSITVEVDVNRGLPTFSIIGLADKSIEEARERVHAALEYSGFESPRKKNQRVVVSLAPANIKKAGSFFDLAILVGYLQASGQIDVSLNDCMFFGEVSLTGNISPISGTLPLVSCAKKEGKKYVFIPKKNIKEASLVDGVCLFGCDSIKEVVDILQDNKKEERRTSFSFTPSSSFGKSEVSFDSIRGQQFAKRAALIAAAGGHNIAFFGSPGSGKSLLAKALYSIIPPLEREQSIETTSIHSIANRLKNNEPLYTPPFRSPHHTSSYVSIIGGGNNLSPGEVSLAHNGVLFLDEFPEFDRRVIESLREPLEERKVTIARSSGSVVFPAQTQVVLAFNPCPCGYFDSLVKKCVCTHSSIRSYRKKLTGPLMDRIDLWVRVDPVSFDELTKNTKTHEQEMFRDIVSRTHITQKKRFKNTSILRNAHTSAKDMDSFFPLSENAKNILNKTAQSLSLSPRAYHRVIRCARTIADIEKSDTIEPAHLVEVFGYRQQTDF